MRLNEYLMPFVLKFLFNLLASLAPHHLCSAFYLKYEETGFPERIDSLIAMAILCFSAVFFGNPFLLKHLPASSHTLNPFPVASILYGIFAFYIVL
jgi:hypothetical protein